VKEFLIAQHMPLGLLFLVVLGFVWPAPGIAVGKTPMNTISIVGIFFISGLGLQTDEVKKALRAYSAIISGLLSILLLSPLLSFAIAPLPLEPKEFALGLALFMAMPTTISTGVLMTTMAKGNAALALLLSVATNLIAVFTVPLYAKQIFKSDAEAAGGGASLNVGDLLLKLLLTIFVPLVVGKALRCFNAVVACVKRFKLQLKLFSSALLISVPWVMMSQSSARLHDIPARSFFLLLALGVGLHLLLFGANFFATRYVPHLAQPERKAVVINSAQKTVNTAVSVILALPAGAGDAGLIVLPCIISHFAQTVIDAVLVSLWVRSEAADAAKSGAAAVASVDAAFAVELPDASRFAPDGPSFSPSQSEDFAYAKPAQVPSKGGGRAGASDRTALATGLADHATTDERTLVDIPLQTEPTGSGGGRLNVADFSKRDGGYR
jgi:sodium/bile acid cotransporter 7